MKQTYSRIFFSFFFILLFTSQSNGNIVLNNIGYSLDEDFSDSDLEGWELNLSVWSFPNLTSFPATQFVVHSGYIEAQGGYSTFETFEAIYETKIQYGVWQMDVNYPDQRFAKEFDWYVHLSDNYFGGFEDNRLNYRYSTATRNGTFMEISQGRINLYNINVGNPGIPREILHDVTIPTSIWIHYDFIRTPESFIVLIDNQLIANITDTDLTTEFNHFVLLTNLGTYMKFDNIKISPDYSEFLDSLDIQSSSSPVVSNQNKSPGFNLIESYIPLSFVILMGLRNSRKNLSR